MRKARIEKGVVAEVLDVDPFPPFHPSLVWVDCDPAVECGDLYDGTFRKPEPIAPPTPVVSPLDKLRAFLSANPDVVALL